MLRPNLSTQRSVPLVSSRGLLGSLALVRGLVGENGEGVATSVGIPIPHAYTARCFATAYRVERFVVLVPHRLEHLVAPRAQLGGVVLVHLPELYTAYSSTVPCPNPSLLLNFSPDGFHRAWESTPGHEKRVAIRDNHGPLVQGCDIQVLKRSTANVTRQRYTVGGGLISSPAPIESLGVLTLPSLELKKRSNLREEANQLEAGSLPVPVPPVSPTATVSSTFRGDDFHRGPNSL